MQYFCVWLAVWQLHVQDSMSQYPATSKWCSWRIQMCWYAISFYVTAVDTGKLPGLHVQTWRLTSLDHEAMTSHWIPRQSQLPRQNDSVLWLDCIRIIMKICDGELQASPLVDRGGFSFACPLGKQPEFLHCQAISNTQSCFTHPWWGFHVGSFRVISSGPWYSFTGTRHSLVTSFRGPNKKGNAVSLRSCRCVAKLHHITSHLAQDPWYLWILLIWSFHQLNVPNYTFMTNMLFAVAWTCVWNPLNSCGRKASTCIPTWAHWVAAGMPGIQTRCTRIAAHGWCPICILARFLIKCPTQWIIAIASKIPSCEKNRRDMNNASL